MQEPSLERREIVEIANRQALNTLRVTGTHPAHTPPERRALRRKIALDGAITGGEEKSQKIKAWTQVLPALLRVTVSSGPGYSNESWVVVSITIIGLSTQKYPTEYVLGRLSAGCAHPIGGAGESGEARPDRGPGRRPPHSTWQAAAPKAAGKSKKTAACAAKGKSLSHLLQFVHQCV